MRCHVLGVGPFLDLCELIDDENAASLRLPRRLHDPHGVGVAPTATSTTSRRRRYVSLSARLGETDVCV
eukprot:18225-Eustigmatos_ZCMA.PRE.1